MVARFLVLDGFADEAGHVVIAGAVCISAARSCSSTENRQVRILPSEVSRTRLQCPQNGCDTGAMIPISPTPSSKTIAARGLAARVTDLAQRHEFGHALHDFLQRDHDLRRPHAIFFQRHELDEAHDHAFFARELAEGGDLVVIEAAQQNAIDLYRIQPDALGRANSREHRS